jgi:DNA (cytosine-5)-methyltransferase 1
MIKVGSDFSGVGAFDQALRRLKIEHETVFACDMDKYARQTYILNYGKPGYYPENVYDREIPSESLDILMSSPPCQSFSLAGKRKGEGDKRGILFYNTHEFIVKNNPRYFIIENVKGLLSDDDGQTFGKWITLLGGKSVNGLPIIFPHEESAPYHVYWEMLNAKHYGVPQNRERVFIVGIRDDVDNTFTFPKREHLTKRLKDVLETEVDEKYFLSEKMIECFTKHQQIQAEKGNGFKFNVSDGNVIGGAVTTKAGSRSDDNFVQIKSATKQGYEIATGNDSINFSIPNSETRRGRVGKGVAQTLDTQCNQGVIYKGIGVHPNSKKMEFDGFKDRPCPTILATDNKAPKCIKFSNQRIRRLTPLEAFRLMDFNEDFKWDVSDSQAYKQAGNSIVVGVLAKIINKFNL